MTFVLVFAALIVANIAFSMYDNRRAEAAQQIDDFHRVEFKKTYSVQKENEAILQSWY